MKKKIFLTIFLVLSMMLALAAVASAAKITTTEATNIVSVTDSNEFGTVSTVNNISVTSRFDTSAKVVLSHTVTDEETNQTITYYTTYPTYYILEDNNEQKLNFDALKTGTGITTYDKNSVIRIEFPASLDNTDTKIGGGILSGSNVIYAKIPKTTSAINWSAFASSKLEVAEFELDVIEGVEKVRFTSLGDAFYNNKSLRYFEFPNGLVNINNCLSGCSAVEWVTIPETVETIGGCFNGCSSLKWVNFSEKTQFTFDSGVYAMFGSCTALKKLYIPSTVTGVSEGRARHFESSGLEEICFGMDINGNSDFAYIGEYTFLGCSKLTTIILPAVDNLELHANAFSNYDKNPTVYIVGDLATAQKTITVLKTSAKFAEYETVTYEAGKSDYGACFVVGATYCQLGWHGNNTYTNDCIENCDICHADVVRLDAKHSYADSILFGEEGYMGYTTKVCACVNCLTPDGEGETLAPLFYNNGYSRNEMTKSIMQSFAIDMELLPVYEAVLGKINFGLVAAVETNQVGTSFAGQLYNEETNAFKERVAWVDMTAKGYDLFEMNVINLAGYEDVDLYCCAYVIADGKTYYLNNLKMLKSAVAASYNDLQ